MLYEPLVQQEINLQTLNTVFLETNQKMNSTFVRGPFKQVQRVENTCRHTHTHIHTHTQARTDSSWWTQMLLCRGCNHLHTVSGQGNEVQHTNAELPITLLQ